jgi:hypothetical protein
MLIALMPELGSLDGRAAAASPAWRRMRPKAA